MQGTAKPRILKLNPVFHYVPSVGTKQLYALAHLGRTHEADTFKYFQKHVNAHLREIG